MSEALPVARLGITAMAAAPLADPQAPIVVGTLPLAVDLTLYRGDDFFLDVTVTNPDGSPYPLTGYTATSQMRVEPRDPDPPVAEFTCTIDTTTTNVIHLHLPGSQSQAVPDTMAWDVQIVGATGLVTTLAFGQATFTGDVTRP